MASCTGHTKVTWRPRTPCGVHYQGCAVLDARIALKSTRSGNVLSKARSGGVNGFLCLTTSSLQWKATQYWIHYLGLVSALPLANVIMRLRAVLAGIGRS